MNSGNQAKEFLEKCHRTDARINGKMSELQRTRDQVCHVTASYSKQSRGGSASQNRLENGVARIMNLEREIIEPPENDRHPDLLSWRYFSMWNWDRMDNQIAK